MMLERLLGQRNGGRFKVRSTGRDAETDHDRITSISTAIESALRDAEAEQAGLSQRTADAVARAAVTAGNDSNEYISREQLDHEHQNLLGSEIASGERRLLELAAAIGHFKFLRTALATRFPRFDATTRLADRPLAAARNGDA
jgi:hypothetical protein